MNGKKLETFGKGMLAEAEARFGLRLAARPAGALEGIEVIETVLPGIRPPHGVRTGSYEAIVERFGRPSLLVQQSSFDIPLADQWRAQLEINRVKIERAIQAVGRVELEKHEASWVGTAWLVAPNVVVTNRHVAVEFTDFGRDGSFAIGRNPLGEPYEIYINFAAEYLQPDVRRARVKKVLYVAPQLSSEPDIAFLEIEAPTDFVLPEPIRLSAEPPRQRATVAVIGYPAYDDRNDAFDMARIFDSIYEVKRLAPGEIDNANATQFVHDATTLGGSSGSLVLDAETGCAIGLHYAGEYLRANYAVASTVVAERLAQATSAPAGAVVPAAPGRVEVSLDGLSEAAPQNLDRRNGYQPDFLGGPELSVALPDYSEVKALAAELVGAPGQHVLHYTHYSVVMNKDRRLAFFTASNIDGAKAHAIKRKGPEQWYYDPRIDKKHQVGNELYKSNELDRGHLVRRLDPVWGTKSEATDAERETFFWTNCTPQHSAFNQRIWLGLEDYILENATNRDFKASVFTGPIFKGRDPVYRDIRLPRSFWKVAVMVTSAGTLSATAYIVSQANLITDIEFVYGAYKTFQVPIATVAKLTHLGFGNLMRFDPLAGESPLAGGRELPDLEAIRF